MATALRKGLTALIFAKSLRLSVSSLAQMTPGKLINICSGDMALFESNIGYLPLIVRGPINLIVIIGLLYYTIGVQFLYVLAISTSLAILQFPINNLILKMRLRIAEASDKRLSLVQTLVFGIQTIKSYAWEEPLVGRIKQARDEEISRFRHFFNLAGFCQGFMIYSEVLLALSLLLSQAGSN